MKFKADMEIDFSQDMFKDGDDVVIPLVDGTQLVILGQENCVDFSMMLLKAVKNTKDGEAINVRLFNDLENKNDGGSYFEIRE
jgi:hypothetical protein